MGGGLGASGIAACGMTGIKLTTSPVGLRVGLEVVVGKGVNVGKGVEVGATVGVATPNSIMGAHAIRKIVNPIRKNSLIRRLTIISNCWVMHKIGC
jgi:hypothetical protein